MAYSTSPVTVEKLLDIMRPLKDGGTVTWHTEPGKAQYLAYKIREALSVVALHPGRWDFLEQHAYEIKVISNTTVQALPREQPVHMSVRVDLPATVKHGAVTPASIISDWMDKSRISEKLYYPRAHLTASQLLELYDKAESMGLVFFNADGAITVMNKTPDLEGLGWEPSDLEEGSNDEKGA